MSSHSNKVTTMHIKMTCLHQNPFSAIFVKCITGTDSLENLVRKMILNLIKAGKYTWLALPNINL